MVDSKEVISDVCVIGGGIAGVCAAIAAGRCGSRVALVHDRPLLGGNASGELKIHIAGADCSGSAIARYVRETGIVDELRIENLHHNPTNSPDILSLIIRKMVEAEPAVDLFVNTRARAVEMASPRSIKAVQADQLTTEKEFVFNAPVFIDATGDGMIGAKAKALYRWGREAAEEFGESLAPQKADNKTLPSCVEFYLKDMGKPTPFSPPSWALAYHSDDDLPFRGTEKEHWQFAGFCGGFWWLSCGGDQSIIADNEDIYDRLLSVLMGIWDHMKNHGDHGAENYALDWISPLPGKRESRRLVGDYILCQGDVVNGRVFDDAVAYGGWPIDLHPPEGVFSKEPANRVLPLSRPYTIPFRSLYSKNIENLFIAGRDISCSHVAFGTTRVMATCGVIGQAAGVGASLAARNSCSAREVGRKHIKDIQQVLLKQGAFIPNCSNTDEADYAKQANVTASGEAVLNLDRIDAAQSTPLQHKPFQMFPLSGSNLDQIEVLVDSSCACQVQAGLCKAADIWDIDEHKILKTVSARTGGQGQEWVAFDFSLTDLEPGMYWIWLQGDSQVSWIGGETVLPGCLRGRFEPPESDCPQIAPGYQTQRGSFALRLSPDSHPYQAINIINGNARPEKWPNLWISAPLSTGPQWIQFEWANTITVQEIHLTFDGQLDDNIIWPEPLGLFGCQTLPAVVKNYAVQVLFDDQWRTIKEVANNYSVRRIHIVDPVQADAVRICFHETNGVDEVCLYEACVY